jgi:uncharacterized membrane protein
MGSDLYIIDDTGFGITICCTISWYQRVWMELVGGVSYCSCWKYDPCPIYLTFFKRVELFLRRFPKWKRAMDWGFPIIRRRANDKVTTYETVALLFFVAIPLPFTGAGLGSLIAVLFDLRFSRSLLIIFIGVIISTVIITSIYLTGSFFIS